MAENDEKDNIDREVIRKAAEEFEASQHEAAELYEALQHEAAESSADSESEPKEREMRADPKVETAKEPTYSWSAYARDYVPDLAKVAKNLFSFEKAKTPYSSPSLKQITGITMANYFSSSFLDPFNDNEKNNTFSADSTMYWESFSYDYNIYMLTNRVGDSGNLQKVGGENIKPSDITNMEEVEKFLHVLKLTANTRSEALTNSEDFMKAKLGDIKSEIKDADVNRRIDHKMNNLIAKRAQLTKVEDQLKASIELLSSAIEENKKISTAEIHAKMKLINLLRNRVFKDQYAIHKSQTTLEARSSYIKGRLKAKYTFVLDPVKLLNPFNYLKVIGGLAQSVAVTAISGVARIFPSFKDNAPNIGANIGVATLMIVKAPFVVITTVLKPIANLDQTPALGYAGDYIASKLKSFGSAVSSWFSQPKKETQNEETKPLLKEDDAATLDSPKVGRPRSSSAIAIQTLNIDVKSGKDREPSISDTLTFSNESPSSTPGYSPHHFSSPSLDVVSSETGEDLINLNSPKKIATETATIEGEGSDKEKTAENTPTYR